MPRDTIDCVRERQYMNRGRMVTTRECSRYMKYFIGGKLELAVCKQEPKTAQEHMGWIEVYALARAEDAL